MWAPLGILGGEHGNRETERVGREPQTYLDLRPLFSMKISQFCTGGIPRVPANSVTPKTHLGGGREGPRSQKASRWCEEGGMAG